MNATAVRAGAVAGMAGGVVMAIWSMVAMRLTGAGFWTPMNLIAHTFWRSAPLDGTFSPAALIIGLAAHMMMAMFFGTLIALVAGRLPGARSVVIPVGMLFVAAVWPAMQYGVWRVVDPAAAQDFTPWVFAVAHLLFGMFAAFVAAFTIPDAETVPQHSR